MRSSTTAVPVFVFGSNLAGRHGKGAALWARQQRGAIYGQGIGRQGNAYGIPTKDRQLRVLPLTAIQTHVADFRRLARRRRVRVPCERGHAAARSLHAFRQPADFVPLLRPRIDRRAASVIAAASNHEHYRALVALEASSTFSFQP